jgi:hypothetical protein
MVLGLEANQWVAIFVGIACLAALLVIVVAPWGKIRAEPPLSKEAQTRLLLGDKPLDIAEDEERRGPAERPSSPRADVLDLDRERRSSA